MYSAKDSSWTLSVDDDEFGTSSSDIAGCTMVLRRRLRRLLTLAFDISDLASSCTVKLSLALLGEARTGSTDSVLNVSESLRRRVGVLVSSSLASDEALVDLLGVRVTLSGVERLFIDECRLALLSGVLGGETVSCTTEDARVIRLLGVASVSSIFSIADIRLVLTLLLGVDVDASPLSTESRLDLLGVTGVSVSRDDVFISCFETLSCSDNVSLFLVAKRELGPSNGSTGSGSTAGIASTVSESCLGAAACTGSSSACSDPDSGSSTRNGSVIWPVDRLSAAESSLSSLLLFFLFAPWASSGFTDRFIAGMSTS